jgi:hypothetical protein
MTRDAQVEHIDRDPHVTCGRLPGVGDEGGVVLYLVGEYGCAVVPPWLPHHHRVLAVALHPVQVRRVRHVLGGSNKILQNEFRNS